MLKAKLHCLIVAACGLIPALSHSESEKPGQPLHESPWEVRYMQMPDQTAEMTSEGRIPGYSILSDSPAEIRIDSGENAIYRGIVIVGKRFHVPGNIQSIPGAWELEMDFQTFNEAANRTCAIFFTPMEDAFWDGLPDQPDATLPAMTWSMSEAFRRRWLGFLACEPVVDGSDADATEWRRWTSDDVLPYLRPYAGKDVVLAFMWVAPHSQSMQSGAFRDLSIETIPEKTLRINFLENALDLSRPELAAVKTALDAGDPDGAAAAFVEHMRTRRTPAVPDLRMDARPAEIERAKQSAKGIMTRVGYPPVEWGDQPNWSDNPLGYEQWTIGNNRHEYWLDMGMAYATTKDEQIAETWMQHMLDFSRRYPYVIGDRETRFIDGPVVPFGRFALGLNAGQRMSDTWWQAYEYFRDYPGFDVDAQMTMFMSIYKQARNLADPRMFSPSNNHGAFETAGLFSCAVMMPEFRESAAWMKTATDRYAQLMTTLVYPDGTPKEISIGYHIANVKFFGDSVTLAASNNVPIDPGLTAAIERMLEAVFYSSRPDFGTVGFGDSNWSGGVALRDRVPIADIFERPDFRYFTTLGAQGTPPAFTSWHSPWAGWYVMRDAWGDDSNYLILDAGPLGTSHYHADKLGIVVQIGKQMVLHETGNYAYDNSPMQQYIRSSWAHNTVVVDNRSQITPASQKETKTELDNRWISNEHFDFADGVYNHGYVDDTGLSNVAHRREILYVKPDYWIVVDHMTPADGAEHDYKALFHLSPGEIMIDPSTKGSRTEWDGGAFAVIPLDPEAVEVEVVTGQTEPRFLGWVPGKIAQQKDPSSVAVYNWKASGPSTRAWLLVPKRAAEPWPATAFDLKETTEAGLIEATIQRPSARDVFRRDPTSEKSGMGTIRLTPYSAEETRNTSVRFSTEAPESSRNSQ